jgi:hypothetical protein
MPCHRTPIEPKVLCRCGHSRARHELITGALCCFDCDCDCGTFVLAQRDPALVPEVERCRVCHGSAQYEVRIELLMLYDFPLTSFSWYLCENCVQNGMVLKFQRDSRVSRRTK